MAVFMLNVCKFNSCGLTFKSLGHLIQHIEETHIDYDPHVVEKTEQQQPPSIPLSYVLRFLTDAARKENAKPTQQPSSLITNNNNNINSTIRSNSFQSGSCSNSVSGLGRVTNSLTPTGSEAEEPSDDFLSDEPLDDDEDEDDDSNDSWTTLEEYSSDFIFRYGSRNTNQINQNSKEKDKPFACPVPGCKKRYKNVNGIKYHSKNGHKNDGKVRKAFKCPCGKSYKTQQGLKNHTATQHNGSVHQIKVMLPNKIVQQPKALTEDKNQQSVKKQIKIPPPSSMMIHDHGYIKQQVLGRRDNNDCENNLGILTPASTPPLLVNNSNNNNCNSSQTQQNTLNS